MKRLAYFDCSSGVSGDMLLGAIVDAGVPLNELKKKLSALPVRGYELKARKVKRAGFQATKVDVTLKPEARSQKSEGRKWKDIEKIIKSSSLSKDIKQNGLKIFKRLFEAEAKVHGEKFDKVHLHELGAVDCIVDIFGTLIGLDILGIKKISSSPLNLGSGTIKTEHGVLPVPAPATVELLRNVSVYSSDINFELTTPTGAALMSSLADSFVPMPAMRVSKIGIGAGDKDFKKQPNVLRIFIGERVENPSQRHSCENRNPEKDRLDSHKSWNDKKQARPSEQNITVIETNIDDMNPQIYEYVIERLFKLGALDVFLTQIIMKKGRPGIKLTVLCEGDKKEKLIKTIFKETTTIGLRFYEAERRILERTIETLDTKFGKIRVKVSRLGDEILKITPEYDDCKKIAKKFNIPLIDVMNELRRNRYID